MQIYGLNGIGQVADIPGAVAGGQKFKMQKDAIDEQKKLENTTWLAGAAKYGLDNWGQPGILEQLVEEGKRRGIIDPQTQPQGITKDGLIKIYQGAKTALGGERFENLGQEQVPYAQRDIITGEVGGVKGAGNRGLPNEAQEYEYFKQLSPKEKEEYLLRKRSQPGIKLTKIPQSDGSEIWGIVTPEGAVFGFGGNMISPGVRDGGPGGGYNPQPSAPPAQPGGAPGPVPGVSQTPVDEANALAAAEAINAAKGKFADRQALVGRLEAWLVHPGRDSSAGFIQGNLPGALANPLAPQQAADAKALRTAAADMLSLDNRSKMKGSGQVSDFESKLLARASTILNDPNISDELAVQEVEALLRELKNPTQPPEGWSPDMGVGNSAPARPQQAAPQQTKPTAAPQVGEVRKGYVYIGGPPNSPSSWQKVNQ